MARVTSRRNRRGNFSRYGGAYENNRQAISETIQQLRELGEEILEAAKTALAEGAEEVVIDAKSRCPLKTGKLKESIQAIRKRNGVTYYIEANAKNDQDISYGQFVEFDPRINRPFLYPAMEANRNQIYHNILESIRHKIRNCG